MFDYLAVFWGPGPSQVQKPPLALSTHPFCALAHKAARSSPGILACVLGHHPPQESRLVLNEDHPEGLFLPRARFRRGSVCMLFPSVASFAALVSRTPSFLCPGSSLYFCPPFSLLLWLFLSLLPGVAFSLHLLGSPGSLVLLTPCPVSLSTLFSFLLSSLSLPLPLQHICF